MYVLMYILASTADSYLSPSLEALTTKFGLSESLAGVTLLAFGNGAPDVFSAIAAARSGTGEISSENILLSISALIGSSVFISSVVMLLATRVAPKQSIQLTPMFFKLEEVAAMVVELKDSGATLSTMEDVKNAYEEKHASTVTLRQVQFVMKSILNMGYTKIIRQNIHANTERCIYSRQ